MSFIFWCCNVNGLTDAPFFFVFKVSWKVNSDVSGNARFPPDGSYMKYCTVLCLLRTITQKGFRVQAVFQLAQEQSLLFWGLQGRWASARIEDGLGPWCQCHVVGAADGEGKGVGITFKASDPMGLIPSVQHCKSVSRTKIPFFCPVSSSFVSIGTPNLKTYLFVVLMI